MKHANRTRVLVVTLTILLSLSFGPQNSAQDTTQPISSRLAFLRAQRAAAASRQAKNESHNKNQTSSLPISSTPVSVSLLKQEVASLEASTPKKVETLASFASNTTLKHDEPPVSAQPPKSNSSVLQSNSSSLDIVAANRNTRTIVETPKSGESPSISVINTCEREFMHVSIKTSRPFFGVIHTRNQRQRRQCSIEGNGDTEYTLDISHVLLQQDPTFCGVIKSSRDSAENKELLSVVLVVRVHRNIELSDDKFFLLNCTNRCRRADCSTSTERFTAANDQSDGLDERESSSFVNKVNDRLGDASIAQDECSIWKFPWIITLLWCMAVLILALLISQCIMCSSLVCRCVKTEVEEHQPSAYGPSTDLEDEDSLYNKRAHPMRVDYDNRDIYTTSNNYEPYTLSRHQESDSSERSRFRSKRRWG